MFNYTDHLGNVRLSYTKDPQSGELKVLEQSHYYPYVMKHANYNDSKHDYKEELGGVFAVIEAVERSNYQYKYNRKEYQDELGLNFYDYGARNYDSTIGRWMNIDPLAEKFFSYTPLSRFDPDGMDVYLVNEQGEFTLALKQAGKDVLYSTFQNKYGITEIKPWDDAEADFGGAITVETGGIFASMMRKMSGVAYFSASTFLTRQSEKIFKFLSDNTNVEFSLTFYKDKKGNMIQLSTFQDESSSPAASSLGISDSNVYKHYHNHPNYKGTEEHQERYTMGEYYDGQRWAGDYMKTYSQNINYPNYVYFRNSNRLYNVTKTAIKLVKNVNNSSDF